MTKREIASLGLKLLGVYALLTTLWVIPLVVELLSNLGRTRTNAEVYWLTVAGVSLQATASLVTGFVLLRYSNWLAAKMVPAGEPAATSESPATSLREWQAIAFSVLGLYLIAAGFPRLAAFAAQLLEAKINALPNMPAMIRRSALIGAIVPCAQMILGVVIFFKARALVAWWERHQPAAN
ncbi:MAG: hypothetical protein PCFJNLEI_03896 [Verrucomicrobiae bacterium]|nr:hypothetical protein [Verrucomicrobiae bacterium]